MPYIKQERRRVYDDLIANLTHQLTKHEGGFHYFPYVGELNYVFSKIIKDCLDAATKHQGLHYSNCNSILGVLECVKQEVYHKVARPYEDKKCEENGDVF
jgi:hypothetical protein